jgi:hypothetical protein
MILVPLDCLPNKNFASASEALDLTFSGLVLVVLETH